MDGEIRQWGKYRIRRLIAKGGMAEIFEAEIVGAAGFAKTVCLKRVRPELMQNEQFLQMFETEARIAAMLHHPNIVSVFDFDRHDGQTFLTMEYMDGCDLKHIIHETHQAGLRLPIDFAVYVMKALLAGLDHAHTIFLDGKPQPVIHRDVSPHNVLLSLDGAVKLTDFGIATSKGLSRATQAGVIKGKLSYLAPEQINGTVSLASDIFSAGLVLYEMLKGERFFRADRDDDAGLKQLHFGYVPVPWISSQANAFLECLLAPDPKDRFQSAGAAENALSALCIPSMAPADVATLVRSVKCLEKGCIEGV